MFSECYETIAITVISSIAKKEGSSSNVFQSLGIHYNLVKFYLPHTLNA